jgi:hypothetical protein
LPGAAQAVAAPEVKHEIADEFLHGADGIGSGRTNTVMPLLPSEKISNALLTASQDASASTVILIGSPPSMTLTENGRRGLGDPHRWRRERGQRLLKDRMDVVHDNASQRGSGVTRNVHSFRYFRGTNALANFIASLPFLAARVLFSLKFGERTSTVKYFSRMISL